MYIHNKSHSWLIVQKESFVVKLSTFWLEMGNYVSTRIYLVNPIQICAFAFGIKTGYRKFGWIL